MPLCKYCQKPFTWGRTEDRWVPLVPLGEDDHLDRAYQDEDGNLRASHRAICVVPGGAPVRVVQLARKVPAASVMPPARQEVASVDQDTGEIMFKEPQPGVTPYAEETVERAVPPPES